MSDKIDDLLERFKAVTLGELTEFNRRFQETFDVSGEPSAPGVPIRYGDEAEVDEPTEFTVTLSDVGASKIPVLKVVRQLLGLGLREAKDLVESAPVDVLIGVDIDVAERARQMLKAEGAVVVVKPAEVWT